MGYRLCAECLKPRTQRHRTRRRAISQRPIQLIVPWLAGGATDITLRILCEEAAPLLGQPIAVINKPGAAGTQVAPLLKAAEPDGHTIGQLHITVYRHVLMNKMPYCSGPLKSEVTELSPRVVDVAINDDFTGPDL